MQTFKQVLIKTCQEKTVNLSFMCICIFLLIITNIFFLFLDKKYITCLMIAFAWNSELHEYLSFILICIYIYIYIYMYIYIYYIFMTFWQNMLRYSQNSQWVQNFIFPNGNYVFPNSLISLKCDHTYFM